ncbi:uncharacterized protein LACBIDRAFT_314666 [Laccaria bicolor S238N-H82]|uniref:Predicted protein n=1 Tax=Laccaria bicolor (strain S238N-H82 / ATCC MYA-4686) TaxID=486041 RepID=B0CWQ9_LACBS|nr:uncharacterized protein LACBIDRAFT_308592 [Laccaria bicolor S238N-H82]XP_001889159.1 uncharacterized protein LACBIDRAFT_314666 [Laccaria bicolor S238N-H82]EDR00102.1 predicted protein [Laccaria bicolor S238N-H82]EDR13551.1 predicted protein [Laccaria bicolor S238N-H82]|eukprot:XP_001876049.1 predicted protein [Laccaria bicolor S238N-H82]
MAKKKASGFTSDSKLCCPKYEKYIPVGTGGKANLQRAARRRCSKMSLCVT